MTKDEILLALQSKNPVNNGSIVDLLVSLGLPSDKASRKALAKELGISDYDLSAKKNTELISAIVNLPKVQAPPAAETMVRALGNPNEAAPTNMSAKRVATQERVAAKESTNFKDQLAKLGAEAQAKELKMMQSGAKAMKASGIANVIGNAGQGILGLAQLVKGKRTLKNLNAPKYPEQLADVQASTRLAEAQREAQMADPLIREQLMRDLANERFLQDERAKVASGGQLGAYGALTQQGATRNIDALRNIAYQEGQDLDRRKATYDQLLSQKMADDRSRYQNRVNRFNTVDMPEYQAKRQYGEQLTQNAIQNLFGGYGGFAQNLPVMTTARDINQGLGFQLDSLSPQQIEQLRVSKPALYNQLNAKKRYTQLMNPRMF